MCIGMGQRKYYLFGEVAEMLGVTKRTLMNWENAGKIPKPRRDPMNRYRIYSEEDLQKLKRVTGRPL
jgi:DNA-binding transcriptional MerR regulator